MGAGDLVVQAAAGAPEDGERVAKGHGESQRRDEANREEEPFPEQDPVPEARRRSVGLDGADPKQFFPDGLPGASDEHPLHDGQGKEAAEEDKLVGLVGDHQERNGQQRRCAQEQEIVGEGSQEALTTRRQLLQ